MKWRTPRHSLPLPLFNSLLTGDAWCVAFSVFAEGIKPPLSFYLALVITVSGVVVYELAPSPVVDTHEEEVAADLELTESNRSARDDLSIREGHVQA